MRRVLMAVVAGLVLLQQGAVRADTGPLAFFKNYVVTGDYATGGTSLWRKGVNGRASGRIDVSGVPDGVDVLAAFLYVQTAEAVQWSGIDRASFNGNDLGPGTDSLAKALNWDQATRPCWSVGWGGGRRLVTYRADVLRFLPLGADGKFAANGTHTIAVPDAGPAFGDDDEVSFEPAGTKGARAIGASLVLVYRDPTRPMRGIVIYDGGATKPAFGSLSQTVGGFYQASTDPRPKMTHVVGDGRPYLSERVRVNGALVATNPYASTHGAKWDTPTFTNLAVPPGAASVALDVQPNGLLSDCVSLSAVVFSTNVQDTDEDGLLDVWESSPVPLADPAGRALPNLQAMGADPLQKDLFVEVGYLRATTPTSYGGLVKPAHSHLPSHEALKQVGDAFRDAPGGAAVRVHFDVGAGYPPGPADPYIIRGAGLARGGEAIDESATVCTPGAADAPWVCQFAAHPGTVGWKSGFRFLRDEVVSVTRPDGSIVPGPDDTFCDTAGYTCVRRFDDNRHASFRYALFAHAVGLPQSELACLDAAGTPVADVADACGSPLRPNPAFHTPRTNTGIGDFPGADLMVTLGAFADVTGLPTGTPFMQASTLLHELGHTFERRHGGEAFEPNCKPTYFSVMNYLYQLRGLVDDAGTPHLDFSGAINPAVDEAGLSDVPIGGLVYRPGWYAPLAGSYLQGISLPATRHCDGSAVLASDVPSVRVDARTAAGPLDWNANGVIDPGLSLDVNFNGRVDGAASALAGSNDWANLRLDQIGARRNVGGLFVHTRTPDGTPASFAVGPLSVDVGKGDLGKGDLGKGDLGKGDLGKGDLGKGDLGKGDLGKGDLGKGDLGKGDLGGGDLFLNDPENPSGELDFETATSLAKTPPNQFAACVIGVDCPDVVTPANDVRLAWTAPTVGGVGLYTVYRIAGAVLTPASPRVVVGTVDPAVFSGQTVYSLIDSSALVGGASYTYFAVATYVDGTRSDPSNVVTIVAVNDPPAAVDDAYAVDEGQVLFVPAPGVLANDRDDHGTLTAILGTAPAKGTLTLHGDGSFTYTPKAGFTGTDTFTYRASDGIVTSNLATVTIDVKAVGYGFVNVKNLPPADGVTFKPSAKGTLVDLEWKFTRAGGVVASADARPRVTITFPNGSVQTFTPENCAPAGIRFEYKADGKYWDFHWTPRNNPAGTYAVVVWADRTGQRFPASVAGFPLVFKN